MSVRMMTQARKPAGGGGDPVLASDDFAVNNGTVIAGRSPSTGVPVGQTWDMLGTVSGDGVDSYLAIPMGEYAILTIPGIDLSQDIRLTTTLAMSHDTYYARIYWPYVNDENYVFHNLRCNSPSDQGRYRLDGANLAASPGADFVMAARNSPQVVTLDWLPSQAAMRRAANVADFTDSFPPELFTHFASVSPPCQVWLGQDTHNAVTVAYSDLHVEYL